MITVRPSDERGRFDHGWLRSAHSFSFGQYHDPAHMGFGDLRVINDDVVAPGKGFDTHPHRDMEIVTFVLSGALEHKDSAGHGAVLRPGEAQRMTAGRGIFHSEFNHSKSEPVRLLQIWIHPERKGLDPGHEQMPFPDAERRNRLRAIATPDASDPATGAKALKIHADARIFATTLDEGAEATLEVKPGRRVWVQAATGSLLVNGVRLDAGDGAAATDETALTLRGASKDGAEALVFDLA